MNSFKAAYINEILKISKKKKFTAALIVTLAVVFITAIIVLTVDNFMGINISGGSEFSLIVLPVMLNLIIPLFSVFVCIDMFCGEYAASTIKITLLAPAPRIKVFLAKAAAAVSFISIMLAVSMVTSFIVSIFIRHTSFAILKIFASYVISLFPLTCLCMMSMLLSNLAKGSGSAFMMCLLFYMAFKVLEILYPQISAFFFTSGMNMYILTSAPLVSFDKIIRMIFIETGFSVMLFAAGYILFDKKEI